MIPLFHNLDYGYTQYCSDRIIAPYFWYGKMGGGIQFVICQAFIAHALFCPKL